MLLKVRSEARAVLAASGNLECKDRARVQPLPAALNKANKRRLRFHLNLP